MPLRSLNQTSFFDPEFACPGCLEVGTAPWLLARFRSKLFPEWLMQGWRGGRVGRKAWPATVLMTLVLLRWTEEGMSRRASVRRARTDVQWRAAMGLALDDAVPSERTLSDFERWLRKRHPGADVPRHILMHEHIVRLCAEAGVVGPNAVWAADTTPMWCYGAVRGTVRMLGDGLRGLGYKWSRATRTTLAATAEEWQLPLLLAKSTKGWLAIDWRDREARDVAVTKLADDVLRIVEMIRTRIGEARSSYRHALLRKCRHLLRVVAHDLESTEDGRLVVARGVAQDRLVSITDPQARHGRKTQSKTFKGYKLHVLGDVVSGLIASVTVTAANQHETSVTHRLLQRAQSLFTDIDRMLGDTAYGAVELREQVAAALGIEIVAPPQPVPARPERLVKSDFQIDFARDEATCPNGVTSARFTTPPSAKGGKVFTWSKAECQNCPLKAQCLNGSEAKRRLTLHPNEQRLRELRAEWDLPETKEIYRDRTQGERLVNQMTRHGGRRARAWGLGAAHLQAHAIATTSNLGLLARAVAAGDCELEHELAAA